MADERVKAHLQKMLAQIPQRPAPLLPPRPNPASAILAALGAGLSAGLGLYLAMVWGLI